METLPRKPESPARRRLSELLAREGPLDLLEACLLVAAEEYESLDVEREVRRVDALGDEARHRIEGLTNLFARLDAVRTYLFEELGFQGDASQSDDPRGCYLNQVLDRRLGIPLSLAILFVEVVRRAGMEARGVGLPGHQVVRVDDAFRTVFVDPFHGGVVITEEDCRELVGRTTGRPTLFKRELLEGTTPRADLARLLQTLKRIYLAKEDYERALAAVERLLLVDPDDHREVRDRGFLLAHLGRPGPAAADLETYLALAPSAPDAESVRGRLAWLHRKLSETN